MAGQEPEYLTRLLGGGPQAPPVPLRAAMRGDCHVHSDWSDGGSTPLEMALAARDLGHEWMALTDHSPRLTVARGLSADRLRAQLELIDQLNADLAPFRILPGIEVDILDDGSLDQEDELLGQLDVVVASVHSKLRMPSAPMTERMITAIRNPHTSVLGHCTGRLLTGRGRPQSQFDAQAVFTNCRDYGVAVEINCLPSAKTLLMTCCGWPARSAASSRSTPTRTRPASLTGWTAAAPARCGSASADRVINARSALAMSGSPGEANGKAG